MRTKKFRSFVCVALSILLVMTNFVYADTAKTDVAKCPDIVGNKYEAQLREWVDNGFIKGAPDGNFKPNNTITRAEFMALVNRSFGFTEAIEINYTDVLKSNWFYKDAAIAAKSGYMQGSNGKLTPQDPISRQEFAIVLARLAGNASAVDDKVISGLADGKSIPEWSRAAISTAIGKGYFEGLIDKSFKPAEKISRLETVVALDRAFKGMYKAVYSRGGTYGPASGIQTLDGNAVIISPDVTLKNTTINGDLILRESIGDGNVYLDNVVVKGTTIVKGGGAHSIVVRNSTLGRVIVRREGNVVRIVATGNTTIGEVDMQSGATLHEEFLTGEGFGDVVIPDDFFAGATVVFEGIFDDIQVDSSNANINVGSGTIGNLTLTQEATGTTVNLSQQASVGTMNLNAAVNITGQGTIQTANVNAPGVTMQQHPQNTVTAPGVTLGTTPQTTPAPTGGSSGGSGGSGGSSNGNGNNNHDNEPSPVILNAIGNIELTKDDYREIPVVSTPSNAVKTVDSSKKNIVAVSISGNTIRVTGIAPGTSTITVNASRTGYQSASTEFTVTVKPKDYTGDSALNNVKPLDFSAGAWSDVLGYNVGFELLMDKAKVRDIEVSLYKGNEMLSKNTGKPALLSLGTNLSTPFNVNGDFDGDNDPYWTYGGWGKLVNIVPDKAVIKVTDKEDNTYTVENTNLSGDPSIIYTFTGEDALTYVQPENFNTHSGTDYKGVNVGFRLESLSLADLAEVEICLYAGSTVLAENTSIIDKFRTLASTTKQFGTPFIVKEGAYKEEYWTFDSNTLAKGVKPDKAVIMVTDTDGNTYIVENGNLVEPNGVSYVKLFAQNYTGDEALERVTPSDFSAGKWSNVIGYNVGFNLLANAADVESIEVNLYKGIVLLSTNTSKDALLTLGTSLSSPFNVSGSFAGDEYWTYSGWDELATEVPDKAVIKVTDKEGNTYTVENTNLSGNPSTIYTFTGSEALAYVQPQDFGVMNFSGVNGYNVGLKLMANTAKNLERVEISLYNSDGSLLQTNISKDILAMYTDASSLSSPFDIDGSFEDECWTYGEWMGELNSIPAKAEIKVVDKTTGCIYTVYNEHLTGNPSEIKPSLVYVDNEGSGNWQHFNNIKDAAAAVAEGGTVMVSAGTYGLTEQLNITKPISIVGVGDVTLKAVNDSWNKENGYKHLLAIYAGTEAAPVTISNITIDADGKSYAVNTYDNAYGILNDVTIRNGKGAGLVVNGSTIEATNLNTSGNVWGAVNVDPGVGVSTPSVFVLHGGILEEGTQIWSDGKNVSASATVEVTADGYIMYPVGEEGAAFIWANKALTNAASITRNISGESVTTVYTSIQPAVDAAEAGDTIDVWAGTYELSAQLNIAKPISIIGHGEAILKAANSSWSTENGHKHLLAICAGTEAAPVTISNIIIDADGKSHAVNTYDNAYGILNDVTIRNGKGAGLTVNGSTIAAANLNTSGNVWGAVNVDPGDGVETASKFTLDGGTLTEGNQIWSDGSNVSESGTVTVMADGYNRYAVGIGAAFFWTDRELPYAASITKNDETIYYPTVQLAIDAADANNIVNVAEGTFVEQLEIDKSITIIGAGVEDGENTVIQAPDTLEAKFTSLGEEHRPVIFINDAEVTLQDLVVDGAGKGNANYRMAGIGLDNAGGTIANVEVKAVSNTPMNGSQHGIGIYAQNDGITAREIVVRDCYIHDYQKNGMTFIGDGLNVLVSGNKVEGAGKTDVIAQNGIVIRGGATGTVENNTVRNNWYNGGSWSATGILIYDAEGVEIEDITGNLLEFNQNGVAITGAAVAESEYYYVEPENFNTHSGTDYKGINVGFKLGDNLNISELDSIEVGLYSDGECVVANTVNENFMDLDDAVKQHSTPFIVQEGDYVEQYWNLGEEELSIDTLPSKALITVVDGHGNSYVVENDNLVEPDGVTYESLFDYPPQCVDVEVSGNRVYLWYNDELDTDSNPAEGDFTVTVGDDEIEIPVEAVYVWEYNVFMQLSTDTIIESEDEVTVSYTPSANSIMDLAGNAASGFEGKVAENITPEADAYEGAEEDNTKACNIDIDGVEQSHTIAPAGDYDNLYFTISSEDVGKLITISTSNLSDDMDTYIYLYFNGAEIKSNDDAAEEDLSSLIEFTPAEIGNYIIYVKHYDYEFGAGSYDISVAAEESDSSGEDELLMSAESESFDANGPIPVDFAVESHEREPKVKK